MVSKAEELKHVAAMKKAGVPQKYVKEEAAEAAAMKCGGKVKKMADGGQVDPREFENMSPEEAAKEIKKRKLATAAFNAASKTPAAPASAASAPRPFAKGGSVRGWGEARGARRAKII